MISSNRTKIRWSAVLAFIAGISVWSFSQCQFGNGPVGELCTSAVYICGNELDGYKGKLPDSLSVDQIWTGLCSGSGTADNIIWFSFTACSSTVTLEITPSNCTLENNQYIGVQAGIYDECNGSASLACTDHTSGNGVTTTFQLTATGVTPGNPLYLFIDGYAGSICEFCIRVIEGVDTQTVTPPDPATLDPGAITGKNLVSCTEMDKPVNYNLLAPECRVSVNSSCNIQNAVNPADSVCYVWRVDPVDGRYFNNADSIGKSAQLVFTKPGEYTIYADSYMHPYYGGSCANGACGFIQSWKVVVEGQDTILNPVEYVCPGDTRIFCGNTISRDTLIYCATDACNVIGQRFIFETSKQNLMGERYICNGGTFTFQGVNYSAPGSYQVVDQSDCALVHFFEIKTVDIAVSVLAADTELNCKKPNLLLSSSSSNSGPLPLQLSWYDASNNLVGTSHDLSVTKPGRYRIVAVYDAQGIACRQEDEVVISADFVKPSVVAFKPVVRCRSSKDPYPILTLTSSNNLAFAEWTLPSGAKQSGMNVQVDSLGAVSGKPYLFTALGQNGCRLDTSFVLETNFEKAIVTLKGDDLTCTHPIDTIIMTTNILIDSVRWYKTLPQQAYYGSFQSKLTHEVNLAGTYKVEAMASSSRCWSDATVTIQDKVRYPELSVTNDVKWNCNTKAVEVIPVTDSGPNFQYLWSTQNGKIGSSASALKLQAEGPGLYHFLVKDSDNGCERSGTIKIDEETNKPRDILAEVSDVRCFGENNGSIIIKNTDGGFAPYTYFVNGIPASSSEISGLQPGSYNIEVRDKYDCRHQVSLSVIEPPLLEIQTPLEINIALNESRLLSFTTNYPATDLVNVVWTNAKGEILGEEDELDFSSLNDDVITVEITNNNGCKARSDIKVIVENDLKIFFPNIFSPNGDGSNDRFVIFKNGIPAQITHMAIYDRLGNMVFRNDTFEFGENANGWDGTFRGRPVENGVYVLILEYADFAGTRHLVKKDITLAR